MYAIHDRESDTLLRIYAEVRATVLPQGTAATVEAKAILMVGGGLIGPVFVEHRRAVAERLIADGQYLSRFSPLPALVLDETVERSRLSIVELTRSERTS